MSPKFGIAHALALAVKNLFFLYLNILNFTDKIIKLSLLLGLLLKYHI